MAWYEGSINTKHLKDVLIKHIVESGTGWERVPSYNSGNTFVNATEYDGDVIKQTINGTELFAGIFPVTYHSYSNMLFLHINLYTNFKANSSLSSLGKFDSRVHKYLCFSRTHDSGALVNSSGYGVDYKISVTPYRIIVALKGTQSTVNSWFFFVLGAVKKPNGVDYTTDSSFFFTSCGISAVGSQLEYYPYGCSRPIQLWAQGIHNLNGNGSIDRREIISPILVKDYNGGIIGTTGFFYSHSENAFREGDEVEIEGITYIALNVNAYGQALSGYLYDSLNYGHANKLNVLLPKQ